MARKQTAPPEPALPQWPADKVERWPIAKLIPYARNARTHTDAQVAQIAGSIREWGWTVPVLVDEAGNIIAGHGRVLAAHRLEVADVPVMVARGWSDAQKRAYTLADNKLTLNAGWDAELLALELTDLQSLGFDAGLAGFNPAEVADLIKAGFVQAPDGFAGYDEDIETEHECPRCGYVFSGGKTHPKTTDEAA